MLVNQREFMYMSNSLPKTPAVPAQADLPGEKRKGHPLFMHSPKCMMAVEEMCERRVVQVLV